MDEIVAKLARRSKGVLEEPEGIDGLLLDAVHIRAFVHSLDAASSSSFEKSYLSVCLQVGATYAVVLKISKLYDRKTSGKYDLNSLREIWKNVKGSDEESRLIANEFNTENESSVFKPIVTFRDKCLAHNEKNTKITSEQIDQALYFCVRVWFLVGESSESSIITPFYQFKDVCGELDKLFTNSQLKAAENEWDSYIARIKSAMKKNICL